MTAKDVRSTTENLWSGKDRPIARARSRSARTTTSSGRALRTQRARKVSPAARPSRPVRSHQVSTRTWSEGFVSIVSEGGELVGRVGRCAATGGVETIGPVRSLGHRDGSRTVDVTFDRSILEDAGMTEDHYDLSVWTEGSDGRSDSTDPERHELSARPTPSPEATPTRESSPTGPRATTPPPTPSAPAASTTEALPARPSPQPTEPPSPTPLRDPGASYSAPEEESEAPGPLRTAATGGAVASAGGSLLALYFLRPW